MQAIDVHLGKTVQIIRERGDTQVLCEKAVLYPFRLTMTDAEAVVQTTEDLTPVGYLPLSADYVPYDDFCEPKTHPTGRQWAVVGSPVNHLEIISLEGCSSFHTLSRQRSGQSL